jgi:hypothetical protein
MASPLSKVFIVALAGFAVAVADAASAQPKKKSVERAFGAEMVENIQAYARSDPGLLGPQGISESVLEAVRQTERPGRDFA